MVDIPVWSLSGYSDDVSNRPVNLLRRVLWEYFLSLLNLDALQARRSVFPEELESPMDTLVKVFKFCEEHS